MNKKESNAIRFAIILNTKKQKYLLMFVLPQQSLSKLHMYECLNKYRVYAYTVGSKFSMTNTRENNRFVYDVHYTKRERYTVAFGKFDRYVHEVKYNLLAKRDTQYNKFQYLQKITYSIKEFTLQENIKQKDK